MHSFKKLIKRFSKFLCIALIVAASSFAICFVVNNLLSNDVNSYSAKCADINYIEYKKEALYNLKLSKIASWQNDDIYYYHLEVEINNISTDSFSDWDILFSFNDNISYIDNSSESNNSESINYSASYNDAAQQLTICPASAGQLININETYKCDFVVSSAKEINLEDIIIDFKDSKLKIQKETGIVN